MIDYGILRMVMFSHGLKKEHHRLYKLEDMKYCVTLCNRQFVAVNSRLHLFSHEHPHKHFCSYPFGIPKQQERKTRDNNHQDTMKHSKTIKNSKTCMKENHCTQQSQEHNRNKQLQVLREGNIQTNGISFSPHCGSSCEKKRFVIHSW